MPFPVITTNLRVDNKLLLLPHSDQEEASHDCSNLQGKLTDQVGN